MKRIGDENAPDDEVDDVFIAASQALPLPSPPKKVKASCSLCGMDCESNMCGVCEKLLVESEQSAKLSPKMIVATRELQVNKENSFFLSLCLFVCLFVSFALFCFVLFVFYSHTGGIWKFPGQ